MATTGYNRTFLKLFDNNITKAHWLDHIIEDTAPIDGSRQVDAIAFNPAGSNLTGEGVVTWNPDDFTINIDSGLGPVLQTGQEIWTLVYNNTGDTLVNGTVVSPVGQQAGRPSVAPAIADTHESIYRPIWVTTMDISHGEYGIATNNGYVRGIDTSVYTLGQEVYISTTVAGEMQSTRPTFPDYPVRVGGVTTSSSGPGELDGEIFIAIGGAIQDTLTNFWNGVFRESFDFLVTSNGTIVTGSLSPTNGHPDMTMIFSDGFTMLETTPDATIVLTPGTSTIPQQNFVYIPQSTKVLTVATSDWPTVEHIKVACICLFDATTTMNDGALRNQNWNDHIQGTTSNQGHLSHMSERMRQMPAAWASGIEATVTINATPDPDEVTIATTSGVVYQLHKQTWVAQDMAIDGHIHVVNDSITPYKSITDLNVVTLDSTGAALTNRYFSVVLWGIQNKSGESSHMMINLPSGSYLSAANAIEDASNYSDYTIPKPMQGVAFLIARLTFNLSAAGSGTWTLEDNQDLRGVIPSTAGGGGAGSTGVSSWTALVDTPVSYLGMDGYTPRVNSAETALEFVKMAALGDNETVTGAWTFNNNLVINEGRVEIHDVSSHLRLFDTDGPDPLDHFQMSHGSENFQFYHYDNSTTTWTMCLEANQSGSLTTGKDLTVNGQILLKRTNDHLRFYETDAADPNDYFMMEANIGEFRFWHWDDSASSIQKCFTADVDGTTTMEKLNFNAADNYITRQVSNSGYFVGSHNIASTTTHSNPIYTLGTSYLPSLTTLGSMYGVGYAENDASFINSTDLGSTPLGGWGLYVASGGVARIWLNSTAGDIHNLGTTYSKQFYSSTPASDWGIRVESNGVNWSGIWMQSDDAASILLRDAAGNVTTRLSADGTNANNYIGDSANTIWHKGNDGDGSGLDADLLDGYDSTDFALMMQEEIDSIIKSSADIVDVFLYNTSKDSDGGVWRERCSHLSWYNETLDTSTRGITRKFPAVALIVAETDTVTIYDATDLDLPMWMVFSSQPTTGAFWPDNGTNVINECSGIAMVNGFLCISTNGNTNLNYGGLSVSIFTSDELIRYSQYGSVNASAGTRSGLTISQRNETIILPNQDTSLLIVNGNVNDVAITALSDAPIDSETGLPIPTIAVATDGGVSVINNDGTIADSNTTSSCDSVIFIGSRLQFTYLSYSQVISDYSSDGFTFDAFYSDFSYTVGVDLFTLGDASNRPKILSENASACSAGLTLFKENLETPSKGMVNYITKDWQSGWMQGDIKGAWLADTDDTNLVGSELVTNGDFPTNLSGWIDSSSGTGSISWNASGHIDLNTVNSTNRGIADGTVLITVIGKTYTVSLENKTTETVSLYVGTASGGGQYTDGSRNNLSIGFYEFTFIATTTTTYIRLWGQVAIGTTTVDNVSMRLADIDRSVNEKGLQVFGTVTKTAVATGAELVDYSGFSASNYLEQPYNSGLDFGTGDFYAMGWLKGTDTAGRLLARATIGNSDQRYVVDVSGSKARFIVEGVSPTIVASTSDVDTDNWLFVCAFRLSGVMYIFVNAVLENNAANTDNITNINAVLRIGEDPTSSNPYSGSLALWRTGAGTPTAEQIEHIYNTEKHLFKENAACTLGGTSNSVQALSYDETTDSLYAGTTDGLSVFTGLQRTNYIDSTGVLTSDNIKAVSAVDGLYLLGSAAEAIVHVPSINTLEEFNRGPDYTSFVTDIIPDYTTLTDNSMADDLHRHSLIVASDGSPDPALEASANGNLSTYGQLDINGLDASADKAASIFLYGTATDLPANICNISRLGGTGGAMLLDNGGGGGIILTTDGDIALSIDAAQIYTWSINSVSEWTLDASGFYPTTDGTNSIGTNTKRPGAVWTDELIVTSNAPVSYNSSGVTGQIQWDSSYMYVYNGTRWGRVAIDFTTTW